MYRILFGIMLLFSVLGASAQGTVRGTVVDKTTEEAISFATVSVNRQGTTTYVAGATTDVDGKFNIKDIADGKYTIVISYVGYKELKRDFELSPQHRTMSYTLLHMTEEPHTLSEVTVTGQKSAMRLEVDRKTFDVSQLISNSGQAATDVLENIPSVEVDNDGNISLRGNSSVEVWINGKASGLTSDNRAQILQQIPAESIERIEVIDNPSAKFSAEGSAGIINIILKKDRTPGYYGSLQAGGSTRGGANTSFNINYSSPLIDAYANIGYRHRKNNGRSESYQEYLETNQFQRYASQSENQGNNLFSRAGITWHITERDDIGVSGMMMKGGGRSSNSTPYHYGDMTTGLDSRIMYRDTRTHSDMSMLYGELNYRHNFNDDGTHFLDFVVNANKWRMDGENIYQDSTLYGNPAEYSLPMPSGEKTYSYQSRPMDINNRRQEVKLDYEYLIREGVKLQAGYQANFSHENTPQQSFIDNTYYDGRQQEEDQRYFNRFIYDIDIHAFYATYSHQIGRFGVMGGLRGEYWKVNTESYSWEQEHDATKRQEPYKTDNFQLFPSLFLSYQLTENDQLQLNYTRRLRRPWGGEMNSFRNTRDATMITFGNPELTPEYTSSFALNYLRTWSQHSLLLSAYYRPTTDVIQRITYQSSSDGMMYQTPMNLARSTRSGAELVVKNKIGRALDLTTNLNAYYYKLNGFSYDIDGQTVTGEERTSFTWDARLTASLILPYDISIQTTGRYRSRQAIAQGYRRSNISADIGLRKNFLAKKFTLSVNCRDLFNSRRWETYSSGPTFTRHQLNKRRSRNIIFTLTWNFGHNAKKKPEGEENGGSGFDDSGAGQGGGYEE
ncbi:MAG: TonB-dependent receptor [Prevotella sp.]|nr:TonB-dependent receptor [Prevotella sp.]